MQFEWDENKNQKNIRERGIDFATASEVFNDPERIVVFNRIVDSEIRMQVIGKVQDILVIMMVYTLHNGNTRIISVRPATRDERREYNEKND